MGSFHDLVKISQFMNQGKYISSQVVTILPTRVFDRCVDTFQGDK